MCFLLTIAAAVVAACADLGFDGVTTSSQKVNFIKAAMPGLTGDREAAARIGRFYLNAHPEYQAGETLVNKIERTLTRFAPDVAKSTNSNRVVVLVKKIIAREFQKNEIEKVAGWILSITEARLYALFALEMIRKTNRQPVSSS